MLFAACMILGVVGLALLATVLLCVWLYKDAQSRGQSGALWVLIAIFASPLVGLLLYFLVGRKDRRVPCAACGWYVAPGARYCEHCGAPDPAPGQPEPPARKSGLFKAMVAATAACVLAVVLLVAGLVTGAGAARVETTGMESRLLDELEINTGWVLVDLENHKSGAWNFTISKASKGWHTSSSFQLEDPAAQTLAVEVSSRQGELLLRVMQGDREEEYDLTGLDGETSIPLAGFEAGRIKVRLVLNGAEDVKGSIRLE